MSTLLQMFLTIPSLHLMSIHPVAIMKYSRSFLVVFRNKTIIFFEGFSKISGSNNFKFKPAEVSKMNENCYLSLHPQDATEQQPQSVKLHLRRHHIPFNNKSEVLFKSKLTIWYSILVRVYFWESTQVSNWDSQFPILDFYLIMAKFAFSFNEEKKFLHCYNKLHVFWVSSHFFHSLVLVRTICSLIIPSEKAQKPNL